MRKVQILNLRPAKLSNEVAFFSRINILANRIFSMVSTSINELKPEHPYKNRAGNDDKQQDENMVAVHLRFPLFAKYRYKV